MWPMDVLGEMMVEFIRHLVELVDEELLIEQ
jgi:hypothetical protein